MRSAAQPGESSANFSCTAHNAGRWLSAGGSRAFRNSKLITRAGTSWCRPPHMSHTKELNQPTYSITKICAIMYHPAPHVCCLLDNNHPCTTRVHIGESPHFLLLLGGCARACLTVDTYATRSTRARLFATKPFRLPRLYTAQM